MRCLLLLGLLLLSSQLVLANFEIDIHPKSGPIDTEVTITASWSGQTSGRLFILEYPSETPVGNSISCSLNNPCQISRTYVVESSPKSFFAALNDGSDGGQSSEVISFEVTSPSAPSITSFSRSPALINVHDSVTFTIQVVDSSDLDFSYSLSFGDGSSPVSFPCNLPS